MNPIKTFDRFIVKCISLVTKSPSRIETIHQFVKFAIIGVINTGIDFAIYYGLTRYTTFFSIHLLTANTISFCVGTTSSFFSNRLWTFGRKDKATIGEASRFYATTLSGLGLSQLLLYVLIRLLSINDLVAKVFTTVVTMIWNFSFKKFFVFTPPKETV